MNLDIAWHNLSPSPAVEEDIRKRFDKLCTLCDDITSARISLDQPHHPNSRPHAYSVMLELRVPSTTLVVDHAATDEQRKHLHQLIHHTFDAARRQVQDYRRVRQGKIKRHSEPQPPPLNEPGDTDVSVDQENSY